MRRTNDPSTRASRGRLENLLFRFMGPPQLGDVNAPAAPTREADCPRCGRPESEHVVVRADRRSRVACPPAQRE